MRRILIKHGELASLADKTGLAAGTISKYLRGLVDLENPEVVERANQVRKLALERGGVES